MDITSNIDVSDETEGNNDCGTCTCEVIAVGVE